MKQIIITLILTYFSIFCYSQKISEAHLYATKSIRYEGYIFYAFDINIVPIVDDSITITKFWIGKRRYFNGKYEMYKNKLPLAQYDTKIIIYTAPCGYGGTRSEINKERIQKKFLPPFLYKGVALVEYYYKSKKYYFIVKYADKKPFDSLYGTHRNYAPETNPERPPYQFQRKQQ